MKENMKETWKYKRKWSWYEKKIALLHERNFRFSNKFLSLLKWKLNKKGKLESTKENYLIMKKEKRKYLSIARENLSKSHAQAESCRHSTDIPGVKFCHYCLPNAPNCDVQILQDYPKPRSWCAVSLSLSSVARCTFTWR